MQITSSHVVKSFFNAKLTQLSVPEVGLIHQGTRDDARVGKGRAHQRAEREGKQNSAHNGERDRDVVD